MKNIPGLLNQPYRFQSPFAAYRFAANATKPMSIILGDCPEFWVVSPADAEGLVKMGYEYAPKGEAA